MRSHLPTSCDLRRVGHCKARGRQRPDSSHVLALMRSLTRLEYLGETLDHALNFLEDIALGLAARQSTERMCAPYRAG
jgi:hypothetical protein